MQVDDVHDRNKHTHTHAKQNGDGNSYPIAMSLDTVASLHDGLHDGHGISDPTMGVDSHGLHDSLHDCNGLSDAKMGVNHGGHTSNAVRVHMHGNMSQHSHTRGSCDMYALDTTPEDQDPLREAKTPLRKAKIQEEVRAEVQVVPLEAAGQAAGGTRGQVVSLDAKAQTAGGMQGSSKCSDGSDVVRGARGRNMARPANEERKRQRMALTQAMELFHQVSETDIFITAVKIASWIVESHFNGEDVSTEASAMAMVRLGMILADKTMAPASNVSNKLADFSLTIRTYTINGMYTTKDMLDMLSLEFHWYLRYALTCTEDQLEPALDMFTRLHESAQRLGPEKQVAELLATVVKGRMRDTFVCKSYDYESDNSRRDSLTSDDEEDEHHSEEGVDMEDEPPKPVTQPRAESGRKAPHYGTPYGTTLDSLTTIKLREKLINVHKTLMTFQAAQPRMDMLAQAHALRERLCEILLACVARHDKVNLQKVQHASEQLTSLAASFPANVPCSETYFHQDIMLSMKNLPFPVDEAIVKAAFSIRDYALVAQRHNTQLRNQKDMVHLLDQGEVRALMVQPAEDYAHSVTYPHAYEVIGHTNMVHVRGLLLHRHGLVAESNSTLFIKTDRYNGNHLQLLLATAQCVLHGAYMDSVCSSTLVDKVSGEPKPLCMSSSRPNHAVPSCVETLLCQVGNMLKEGTARVEYGHVKYDALLQCVHHILVMVTNMLVMQPEFCTVAATLMHNLLIVMHEDISLALQKAHTSADNDMKIEYGRVERLLQDAGSALVQRFDAAYPLQPLVEHALPKATPPKKKGRGNNVSKSISPTAENTTSSPAEATAPVNIVSEWECDAESKTLRFVAEQLNTLKDIRVTDLKNDVREDGSRPRLNIPLFGRSIPRRREGMRSRLTCLQIIFKNFRLSTSCICLNLFTRGNALSCAESTSTVSLSCTLV